MKAPIVSVVIPTFNRAAFLPGAIASVQRQTLQDFEIVVVDDGSTDETIALVTRLAASDPRIRLIRTANEGPSAARNIGWRAAGSPWILFLDDDDFLMPDCLATLRATVRNDTDAVAAYSWRFMSESTDLDTETILKNAHSLKLESWPPAPDSLLLTIPFLLLNHPMPIHAGLFSRAALQAVGGFKEELYAAEDFDLWLRIASRREISVLDQHLAFYRFHATQASAGIARHARSTRRVVEGFLDQHPEAKTEIDAWVLRRRLALLARDEAYGALLAGDQGAAVRAITASLVRWPLWVKSWFYLVCALSPSAYRWLRDLWRGNGPSHCRQDTGSPAHEGPDYRK